MVAYAYSRIDSIEAYKVFRRGEDDFKEGLTEPFETLIDICGQIGLHEFSQINPYEYEYINGYVNARDKMGYGETYSSYVDGPYEDE